MIDWISVKDKLPEVKEGSDGTEVIVFCRYAHNGGHRILSDFFWNNGEFNFSTEPIKECAFYITHWAIPNLPAEEQQGDLFE